MDQEKGPPTPVQRPPYHSALIPGTSPELIHPGVLRYLREIGVAK